MFVFEHASITTTERQPIENGGVLVVVLVRKHGAICGCVRHLKHGCFEGGA